MRSRIAAACHGPTHAAVRYVASSKPTRELSWRGSSPRYAAPTKERRQQRKNRGVTPGRATTPGGSPLAPEPITVLKPISSIFRTGLKYLNDVGSSGAEAPSHMNIEQKDQRKAIRPAAGFTCLVGDAANITLIHCPKRQKASLIKASSSKVTGQNTPRKDRATREEIVFQVGVKFLGASPRHHAHHSTPISPPLRRSFCSKKFFEDARSSSGRSLGADGRDRHRSG